MLQTTDLLIQAWQQPSRIKLLKEDQGNAVFTTLSRCSTYGPGPGSPWIPLTTGHRTKLPKLPKLPNLPKLQKLPKLPILQAETPKLNLHLKMVTLE